MLTTHDLLNAVSGALASRGETADQVSVRAGLSRTYITVSLKRWYQGSGNGPSLRNAGRVLDAVGLELRIVPKEGEGCARKHYPR